MFGVPFFTLKERLDRLEAGARVIRSLEQGQPLTLKQPYFPLEKAESYPLPERTLPHRHRRARGEAHAQDRRRVRRRVERDAGGHRRLHPEAPGAGRALPGLRPRPRIHRALPHDSVCHRPQRRRGGQAHRRLFARSSPPCPTTKRAGMPRLFSRDRPSASPPISRRGSRRAPARAACRPSTRRTFQASSSSPARSCPSSDGPPGRLNPLGHPRYSYATSSGHPRPRGVADADERDRDHSRTSASSRRGHCPRRLPRAPRGGRSGRRRPDGRAAVHFQCRALRRDRQGLLPVARHHGGDRTVRLRGEDGARPRYRPTRRGHRQSVGRPLQRHRGRHGLQDRGRQGPGSSRLQLHAPRRPQGPGGLGARQVHQGSQGPQDRQRGQGHQLRLHARQDARARRHRLRRRRGRVPRLPGRHQGPRRQGGGRRLRARSRGGCRRSCRRSASASS